MQAIARELYIAGHIKESLQCYSSIMNNSTQDLFTAATLLIRHCPENPLTARAVSKLAVLCRPDNPLYFNVLDLQIKLNPSDKLLTHALSESTNDLRWNEYFQGIKRSPYVKLNDIIESINAYEYKSAINKVIALLDEIESGSTVLYGRVSLEQGNAVELLGKDQLYALVYIISAITYKPSNPIKSMALLEQSIKIIDRNSTVLHVETASRLQFKRWFETARKIALDQFVQCKISFSQFSQCKHLLSLVSEETRAFYALATTGCCDWFSGHQNLFHTALAALHSNTLDTCQFQEGNPASQCLLMLGQGISAMLGSRFLDAKFLESNSQDSLLAVSEAE